MVLNDIIKDEFLNKLFEDSIGKTYHRYKLSLIMEKEDFYQDTCIFLINGNRLKNFDSNKSTIRTYLPLLIMTSAKKLILKAHGQCKGNEDKLFFENSHIRLDNVICDDENNESFSNFISDDNYNLENISMDNIMVEEILEADFLSEKQRAIIYLMLKGLIHVEIAKKLGLTRVNINYHYKKAKEKIILHYKNTNTI